MITSLKFEIWGFKKSPKNKKAIRLRGIKDKSNENDRCDFRDAGS